jgi:transcriptional antiterminator RfaH
MDRAWYTVQAKRHNEDRVVHHLANREIPSFLPLLEVVRRRNGSPRIGLEPLFPGYVFIHMAPFECNIQAWNTVRWSPGVHRILGSAEEPIPVPDEAIDTIRDRMSDSGFVRPAHRFGAGDTVRFRSGPMQGLEAILDRPSSRVGRVQVLMTLLDNAVRVEADELDLELA